MADQVTIYRWDDPGAPQITNASRKPSEIMSLLKACLVDGYGTKQPLGWSIVEENINSATPYVSFRNAGSGGVVRFENLTSDNTGEFCWMRSHQEYVDRDNNAKASFWYGFRNLSSYSQFPARNWVLIGTGKAFWFIQQHPAYNTINYTGRTQDNLFILFCGDFYSVFPNDPCTFTQITSVGGSSDRRNDSYGNMLPYALTQGTATSTNLYALDNTNSHKPYSLLSALGVGSFNAGQVDGAPPQINVMADVWLKLGATSGTSYESAGALNDSNFPMLRGRVPGLYISDQSGWRSEAFPVIKTIGSSNYLQMPDGWNDASAVWIKLDEWQ